MIIKNIKLNKFRGHFDTEIAFDERLTIIVGQNGSGKSSILDGIAICLSWIVSRIKNPKGQGAFIGEEEVYSGQRDATITACFDEIEEVSIPNKTKRGYIKTQSADLDLLNHYCSNIRTEIDSTSFKTSLPVFVHYGVRRAVLDIPLRIKKSHKFDLLETYNESLNGDASFRTFFEWFRYQEDIENENYRHQRDLFSAESSVKPDRELSTVRRALEVFLPEYTNIHVKRSPLQMLVEKNGQALRIDQLSDGEKIYIAMVGDLCKRLVLANPTLDDPLQGTGIVLIDELDLHLHPKWQTDIAPRLTQVFPNIQFIVSTHSPLVVTNVQSESLRVLEIDNNRIRVNLSGYGYGLPTSIVLKDLMGLEWELPEKVEVLKRNIYQALNDNNLATAIELYTKIEALTPYLPELIKIRKLIERKQRV